MSRAKRPKSLSGIRGPVKTSRRVNLNGIRKYRFLLLFFTARKNGRKTFEGMKEYYIARLRISLLSARYVFRLPNDCVLRETAEVSTRIKSKAKRSEVKAEIARSENKRADERVSAFRPRRSSLVVVRQTACRLYEAIGNGFPREMQPHIC